MVGDIIADSRATSPGIRTQGGFVFERAAGTDVIGDFVDQALEGGVAGQSEDEGYAVLFAPRHHFRAAVMAVAADRNLGQGPVPADAADEAAQMAAHLLARRRLAGRSSTATGRLTAVS